MREYTVNFISHSKSIRVPPGTDILTAAARCGLMLNAACGGEGVCGKCKVYVRRGSVDPQTDGCMSGLESKDGAILACQALVEDDLDIEIPQASIEERLPAGHGAEEFTRGAVLPEEGLFPKRPLVDKFYIELSGPSAGPMADLERICSLISGSGKIVLASAKLAAAKHLSRVLSDTMGKVTIILSHKDGGSEITAVEPQDTSAANYGIAFDIGTTTIAGQLINLITGVVISSKIVFNSQAVYGSDIISRIIHAQEQGMDGLYDAVIGNMNDIALEMTAETGTSPANVYSVTVAGNMTMMHLLLRLDPSWIRKAQQALTATLFPPTGAGPLGLSVNPKATVYFMPGVASYVGGDIVSGLIACGLYNRDELTLLIDIGTNGEIVLGCKDWMMATAASAGPAFEGSGLGYGMKASPGAINKISVSGSGACSFETISGSAPKGICGSGYIDLLISLRENGLMDKNGKLVQERCPERMRSDGRITSFVVAPKDVSAIGQDITIDDNDIENLKRSKAAIYSAVSSLLSKVDKRVDEIKKIYIAGGFGNYLNIENAVKIGLLPDAPRDRYEFIGNSSLAGARMSLISEDAFNKACEIYKNITYIDLSFEPGYMDEYVAALFFPHTDIGRFPSVRS